jgi:aminodeoxychorismate synthase component I
VRLDASPASVCRKLRRRQPVSLFLDGTGHLDDAWQTGPLVAIEPACVIRARARAGEAVDKALLALDRLVAERRKAGGAGETGIAALLSYELFHPTSVRPGEQLDLVVLTVDRSARFMGDGNVLLTSRGPVRDAAAGPELLAGQVPDGADVEPPPARCVGRPATTLPREAYLRAVERVKDHIARGDIYQGNLCQRFQIDYAGDPFEAYASLARTTPAPRSAFLETSDFALASVSPETFLRVRRPGELETWPIKGTRPRGATAEEDRAAARGLMGSAKDRAELLMIVDLERNDLSRVCRAGTVEVSELAGLRTYAAVHHLVACVHGRLASGVGIPALLRATFPGGSITGAPKIRAMEILRELEPVRRGFFTGSLFWFGDDGRLDSSILIRTWVFGRKRAWLGAGGGIVADSEPDAEWRESNHKARALAAALGFDPEEAV